jgi:signal transduction histidine kinase/CheY-like chemotaxis protein/HPt (histidine-containing phosphotransfer) domain-containing protein
VDRPQIWVRTVGSVEMENGRPVRLTGTAQDVSDRVAERQALQSALERLSLATESCDIGIWDWNIGDGSLHWDARMYALHGLPPSRERIPADIWNRHLHPDDRARAEREIADGVAGLREFKTEFRVVWPDGTVRDIAATSRVTRDARGRPLHMVGANWDITDRRAAEALRAAHAAAETAARAKSEFLATMSHEIRSPLSGLIGVLDLLQASELNGEQARMAKMADRSAAMLLAVLNDILDFSKIEAGAMAVVPVAVELRASIDEMAQPLRLAAAHKRLDFNVVLDPDLPEWLTLDRLRLRQILNNLISNAIKFTTAGFVRLSVTVHTDGNLRFEVSDTGIGMSAEVVTQLFAPFMQADGSISRRFGGTGLGLSISHKLAGLMGGSLTARSRVGEGSVFCLTLPIVACNKAPDAAGAVANLQPNLPPSCRILLVDDDPTIRWLSQQQILKLGLSAEIAEDGVEALARLQTEPFDLLLTDCHMPGLDGVALTRAVRAQTDAPLRAIPIIGLTADVTEAQRDLCMAAGMSELAIKPLTTEGLAHLLHRHLGRVAAKCPPPEAPALRRITFDDQIFLSIFTPGDMEGAAWLSEYLDSARQLTACIATLLAQDAEMPPWRGELASQAHRLAGASFSVGAILLGNAARALELASPQAPRGRLLELFDTVNQHIAPAAAAMEHLLSQGNNK